MEEAIKKAYYDPRTGYVGIEKLYKKLEKQGISKSAVKKWMKKQEVYQVNQAPDLSGSFIPSYPLQEFQIDLIYLDDKHLNNASYGLCCIDVFTKLADIELMKKKDEKETVRAMRVLLEKMGTPEMIYCDEGSEFNNKGFKKLMDEYGIELVLTMRHAGVVERFNRTIKNMMSKYLQATKTKTISKVLPKLLDNYNNSYHKSIGMAPNEVNEKNYLQVWHNLAKRSKKVKRSKLEVGDKVRILIKDRGQKKYKPRWSEHVYEIEEKDGQQYKIKGLERSYLRPYLYKVNDVEKYVADADFDETTEKRLKELAKEKVRELTEEEKPTKDKLVNTRSKREYKINKKLFKDFYT